MMVLLELVVVVVRRQELSEVEVKVLDTKLIARQKCLTLLRLLPVDVAC